MKLNFVLKEGFSSSLSQQFVNFKKIGKMITPSDLEIKINRRSRSAKLRIAERI